MSNLYRSTMYVGVTSALWNRLWKFRIIEEMNPHWLDLHERIDSMATLVEERAGPPPSRG